MPGFPDGLGAAHSLDIQYVISVFGKSAFTPAQQTLSDQMIGYWTRFARTADPNGSEATAWPRFRQIGDSLQLAPGPGGIHTADLKAKHNCAFFSSLGLLPSF
jgi:para-nitrobenzyl esterase